ncbi:MAG: hypothetical protein K2N55_12245, partial [Lachnospiraceae bacterium]|nr:hypothetical protein [Lachnospiraceae bacterium]
MTSAPVKDVSSLMNFVGGKNLTRTGGTAQMGSFGDVMSRTQNGSSGSQNQAVAGKDLKKTSATDTVRSSKAEIRPKEEPAKPADEVKADGMTKEQNTMLDEAGREVVKEIAEEFEVSPEDVEKAMEMLGLSVYSLFDPSQLRQLVLELQGVQDVSVLLTDETLFAKLQNVLNMAAEVKTGLAEELGMNPEELKALLEELQNSAKGSVGMGEEIPENDADNLQAGKTVKEEAPKITVEVKAGDETVKLSTDEKGNVTGQVEVVPSESKEDATKEYAGGHEQKGNENSKNESEGKLQAGNMQMDALLQN